jgi:aspartate/methionine/tyrosine aminotransferase
VLELDKALAAAPGPADLIDLTHGDTRAFVPPAAAAADFAAAVTENTEAYTAYRGSASLRSVVAPRLSRLLGRPVDGASQVIVTPGTQGGLFTALSALISPGDRVALPDPEYFMSERIIAYLGGKAFRLPLSQDSHGRLSVSPDALTAAAATADLLVLSHPNNPTGGVYTAKTVQALAELVTSSGMLAVVDQLYCRLTFAGTEYVHLSSLPGMAERTVTLLGPSKTESMSGYRVGVAVGPPPVIDAMERVLSLTSLRTGGYSQQVLRHWMADDDAWLAERTAAHEAIRDDLVARLRAIPGVNVASPAGSSYVFPDASATAAGSNDHDLALALKAAGVLVSPGYQFGPSGRGRFRLNFSQDAGRLALAVDRIEAVLRD